MRAIAFAVLLAASAHARTINVAEDGSGEFAAVLDALPAAQPGDVIALKSKQGMVGLEVKQDRQGLVVVRALPGSPAYAAGLKPGDRILLIDDRDISRMPLAQAVQLIRGAPGTTVKLRVLKKGADTAEPVSIVRGQALFAIDDGFSKVEIARQFKDVAAAVRYALPLAKTDKRAQSFLAFAYYNGSGVSQDYAESARLAKLSAEAGYAPSQRLLGVLYFEGKGVDKDLAASAAWTRKAALQGDAYAERNLGQDYAKGIGMAPDPDQARVWYRKAIAAGLTLAQKDLDELGPEGAMSDETAGQLPASPAAAPAPAEHARPAVAPVSLSGAEEELEP